MLTDPTSKKTNRNQCDRRKALTAIACITSIPWLARAQSFPSKAIRLVVPAPAGSGPDIDIRQISNNLSALLGQPVLVENRPGAGGRLAIDAVLKSTDGHTFYVGTPGVTTMATLYPRLGFDPRRDLVPVSLVSVTNFTLTINAQLPAMRVAEYIKLAQSDNKFANFGTFGSGSINHLRAAQFAQMSDFQAHYIHYSTSSPFTDLASGQISAMFCAMLPVAAQVKAGRLRTLVTSGKSRHPMMPEVPTFRELGLTDFDPQVWIGLLAPVQTPAETVKKMSSAMAQVARMAETLAQRQAVGSESIGSTPQEFEAYLEAERFQLTATIQKLGLTLE
jgi:tripartite-type tricarboxylate transporter receptor subunit TctC